ASGTKKLKPRQDYPFLLCHQSQTSRLGELDTTRSLAAHLQTHSAALRAGLRQQGKNFFNRLPGTCPRFPSLRLRGAAGPCRAIVSRPAEAGLAAVIARKLCF